MACAIAGEGRCRAARQANGLLHRAAPMRGCRARPICQILTSVAAAKGRAAMPVGEVGSGTGITSRNLMKLMRPLLFSCLVEVDRRNLGHGTLPF